MSDTKLEAALADTQLNENNLIGLEPNHLKLWDAEMERRALERSKEKLLRSNEELEQYNHLYES